MHKHTHINHTSTYPHTHTQTHPHPPHTTYPHTPISTKHPPTHTHTHTHPHQPDSTLSPHTHITYPHTPTSTKHTYPNTHTHTSTKHPHTPTSTTHPPTPPHTQTHITQCPLLFNMCCNSGCLCRTLVNGARSHYKLFCIVILPAWLSANNSELNYPNGGVSKAPRW